jgi:D-alanyl-D-alanine carboxypeptidase
MRATLTALSTFAAILTLTLVVVSSSHAQQPSLAVAKQSDIDKVVADTLAHTGVPSASIAIVKDGQIEYEHAYGNARLDPALPASTSMRYSIGSISKQFTSSAMLLLAEQHKLSIDETVARFLPDLTRANEVTIREVLSMTSGYQDYWPQDYLMPPMRQSTDAHAILDRWAKKPLDFEPGTKWQYSNTNYVAAGLMVEKASGQPLLDFLQTHVFSPLHMTSVSNTDLAALPASDPGAYLRYALGPLRPAPKEGKGWMFAAGELAMTPHDLALWDISVIDQKILTPASYAEQQREVLLKDGVGTGYGLGVQVGTSNGHRRISHSGEVSGFTAENDIYPDDHIAIVVLTNQDATSAPGVIAGRLAPLVFATSDLGTELATKQASKIFEGLQQGKIDRSLFTDNCNAYFDDQALADFKSSLAPLGAPASFTSQGQSLRGGMIFRSFLIRFPQKTLRLTTFTMPDGKLEQYLIAAVE